MSLTYSINGFVLESTTQTEGMWLLEGTEYAPALSPRRSTLEIPGVHYEIPSWGDPMSSITLSLNLRLQYQTADALREGWNLITGLLGMGTNMPVQVQRIRGSVTEQADAQLISSTSPDFLCSTNRADPQIVMNIPGGSWRGDQLDQDFPVGEEQSVVVSEESTRPIADALLRVPGPLVTLGVTDTVSGTGVSWGGGSLSVPEDEWLLIDVMKMRAAILDADSWNVDDGEPASGSLVFTGFGPLSLVSRRSGPDGDPVSGLTVTMSGGTGPLTIRARPAVV